LLDGIGHIMGIVRPFRLEKVLGITDETCPYSTLFLKSVPLCVSLVFAGRWIEETSRMYSYRLAACGTDWKLFYIWSEFEWIR